MQFNEPDFLALGRSDRSRLQKASIERCQEIKALAMQLFDAATDARESGDLELSQQYVGAVNQLGEQLRDADVTLVFQQLGEFLATAKPEE